MKTDEEKRAALNESQKRFDVDPRSENEIKKYLETQTVKRLRNADRNQFIRYRAVLGDEMPTFAGWRRMKQADSERYQELRSDYRYALKIMDRERIIISGTESQSLPIKGRPGSITDLEFADGGIKQRRLFDGEGRPKKDIDNTDHGNRKAHPYVPHVNDWDFSNDKPHGAQRPLTPEEKRQNKDIVGGDDD